MLSSGAEKPTPRKPDRLPGAGAALAPVARPSARASRAGSPGRVGTVSPFAPEPARAAFGRPASAGPAFGFAAPAGIDVGQLPVAHVAFLFGMGMIILRMAVLPEMIAQVLGVGIPILYILGPATIMGLFLTGGFARTFRAKSALFWTGFVFCILLATPFSTWVGGSMARVQSQLKSEYVCLFALAGTITVWGEIRKTYNWMAVSGVIVLIAARLWSKPGTDGRLSLDMGTGSTIGNPNDLAAHLILLIPFLVLLLLKPETNKLLKLLIFGAIGYGLYIILGTASRGALIGMVVMALIFFIRATGRQRMVVMVIVPLMGFGLASMSSASVLVRLGTLFASDEDAPVTIGGEAEESMASRSYLLKKSIEFTLEHPLFGVGPGQFAIAEGFAMKAMGERGNWHETHNSYTQASSECGVPAMVLMVAGLVSCLLLVNKTYRRAKAAGLREIQQYCTAFQASLLSYMIVITFLACAYRFTLPAMISLGIALHYAGEKEIAFLTSKPQVPAN